MAIFVRCLSAAVFAGLFAYFWFDDGGPRDAGAAGFIAVLLSGLLIPLAMASRRRPYLTIPLLVGLVCATIGTCLIIADVKAATNSTAALGYLLIPFAQLLCFGIALAIGFANRKSGAKP